MAITIKQRSTGKQYTSVGSTENIPAASSRITITQRSTGKQYTSRGAELTTETGQSGTQKLQEAAERAVSAGRLRDAGTRGAATAALALPTPSVAQARTQLSQAEAEEKRLRETIQNNNLNGAWSGNAAEARAQRQQADADLKAAVETLRESRRLYRELSGAGQSERASAAAQAEYERLTRLDTAQAEKALEAERRQSAQTFDIDKMTRAAVTPGGLTGYLEATRGENNAVQGKINALEADIEGAKRIRTAQNYMTNTLAPDFARNSRYRKGSIDDADYAYINRDPEAIKAKEAQMFAGNGIVLDIPNQYVEQMSDDQIAMFNYLYHTKGKDTAYEYIKFLEPDLNAAQRQQETRQWQAEADAHPAGASAVSVIMAPMKGASYLGQAVDYLADGKIDQNAAYNRYSYASSGIRQRVSELAEDKWGKKGSFLYQTGMSMGDFLMTTLVSGGFSNPGSQAAQKLALSIMGTGAAADSTIAAKDRGLSDDQAFAIGTVAGAAEVITEKVSLDNLLDMTKLGKNKLGYFLQNVLAEGSEEVGSDFINLFADILVAKDKSEWQQSIDQYKAQGMDEKTAFWHAAGEQAENMGLDFLGGALSGGIMSGGAIIGNRAAGSRQNAGVSAGTQDRSVKKSPYTEQEADAIRHEGRTFRNIIAGIDTTVSDFFNKWQGGRKSHQGEKLEKLYLGKLSEDTLMQVSGILNYEVDSRDVIVTNDDVKHIRDRHPDLQEWVFEALTDVVAQPDTVRGDHEGSGKNIGKTSIVFEKTMPSGTIVCAQFDNPGRGTMQVTSVYLKHSGKNKTAATPSMMNPPQSGATSTPETTEPVTTVKHSIPQSTQKSKGIMSGGGIVLNQATGNRQNIPVFDGVQTTESTGQEVPGGVRYSLKKFDDGTAFVDVDIDQERFSGLTTEEMQNEAKKVILERFRNKVIGTEYKAFVNKRAAEHYAYPANRRMDETQKQDKMQASTELDNIIEASVFRENVPDDGRHPSATGGIDKLDTKFRVNGRLYEAEISVLVTDRGRLFYDLTKFKDITRKIGLTTHKGDAAEAVDDVSINSIRNSDEKVNGKTFSSTRRIISDEARAAFGTQGQQVIDTIMEQTMNRGLARWEAYAGFSKAYQWGLTGGKMGTVPGMSKQAVQIAYNAGKADAATTTATNKANAPKAKVYGAEAGIYGDTSGMDMKTRNTLRQVAKVLGVRVEIVDSLDGAGGEINGPDIKILKTEADHVKKVVGHEFAHRLQELAPEAYNAFRSIAAQERGGDVDGYLRMYQAYNGTFTYERALDEVTADYAGDLIENSQVLEEFIQRNGKKRNVLEWLRDVARELAAKLTGNEKLKAKAAEARLTKALEAAVEQAKQNPQTNENTATVGGETRQYLNPEFARRVDDWLAAEKKNLPGSGRFFVGTTSEALKSVGVSDYSIYWSTAKISKIMEEHPNMTADVIKSVPSIVENPIIVMQSQTVTNRITLFGETIDAEGKPVLVAVELSPQNKHGEIQDFAVIASAYGKNGAQQLIDSSDILYIDPNKERTDSWLKLLRLQLPSRITSYGSIGSVTYVNRDVNGKISFGDEEEHKTAMQAAFEKAQEEKNKKGKNYLAGALSYGAGAVSEGLEELIGDWMEWQMPRIYGGEVDSASEVLANSLYDFAVGTLSGMVGVDQLNYDTGAGNRQNMPVFDGVESQDAVSSGNNTENTMLTENDLEEYLKVGEREHVRDSKNTQVMRGQSPILTTIDQIKSFIRSAMGGNEKNTIKAYGKVGSRMAGDILAVDGNLDVSNYYLELDANRLAHLSEHVGDDGDARNIPLTQEQAENLTEYINGYDDILNVIRRKDGSIRVTLGKKINGHAVIVELVSKGRKSIQPVTAWQLPTEDYLAKYSKTKKTQTIDTSHLPEREKISGYKPSMSINSIPQSAQKSKGIISDEQRVAFGTQGQQVIETVMEQTMNRGLAHWEAYAGFSKAYQWGLTGGKMGTVPGMSKQAVQIAYEAGKADAAATTATNKANAPKAKVYGAEAGIYGDTSGMDMKTRNTLRQVAKALGVRVEIVDSLDGTGGEINGPDIKILKTEADHVKKVVGHEFAHRLQELAPEAYNAFRSIAAQERGGDVDGYLRMYQAYNGTFTYERALDEVTADYAGDLIENSQVLEEFIQRNGKKRNVLEWLRDVARELAAKLTGNEKLKAKAAETRLTKALEAAVEQAKQNPQTNENTATVGGETRQYLNPEFSAELDAWDGKSERTFHIGKTSEPLRSIGVQDRGIIWHSRKMAEIMKKHPGMTREVLKQVPGILENPVIVLKSKQSGTRLAVFGEVYDEQGAPVTAILELQPTTRGGELLDMNVIASAYGKDTNPADFIRKSEVLYIDTNENRTQSWMQGLGLQLPSDTTALGSIGTITYQDGDVKIEGVPFEQYMQGGNKISNTKNYLAGASALAERMRDIDAERGGKTQEEVDAEIDAAVQDILSDAIKQYGALPAGEHPAREVHIPKKTSERERVSQTVRTVLEAKATPDELLPDIERLVAEEQFSYESYGDEQAIRDAEEVIRDKSTARAYADWRDDIRQGVVSKEHTALGWTLYNNAANSGDTKMALDILQNMVDHQRSAAQALQATRILKTLSPETRLYNVQRSVRNLQEELKKRYKDKAPTLKLDEELAADFLQAETEEAREAAEAALYRDIGRQMPSTFIDKWNAWRYLSMLGNARTHARNLAGNAGFMPVVAAKNALATGLETAVDKVSGGKAFSGERGERTKSLTAGTALYRAAFADYQQVVEQIMEGGKYQDFAQKKAIEDGRVIFKTKPLEWARRQNGALLELEDSWFAKPHYAAALASYCKANGITAEQVQSGKGLDKAREYAIREAQKATYRDTNDFSQWVSSIGRYSGDNKAGRAASKLLEGILPFRKTPANILARGVEYSPIGLLERITRGTYRVAKGRITTAEWLDGISAGLTGTGLLGLGFWLAGMGLARGGGSGDDDKKRKFDELTGHQEYSLELPDGTSVTLDWLAPEALPFFVGVNLYEELSAKNGGERLNMADWMKALGNVSEPMLEMSCLQSLNDLFDSVSYGKKEGSALGSAVFGSITSYLMQGLPTLFGQAERAQEDKRMTTYTEDSNWLTKDLQYTLGKASARIPGLDFLQIPYIDAWGREELTGKPAARVANNFLNPAYTSKIDESGMEQELLRLYEQTGNKAVFPERAGKSITVDKVEKKLTGEEYVKYATAQGQTAYSLVCKLVDSKAYRAMDDETKAACIEDAYDYAEAYAKTQVSDYEPTGWQKKAFNTIRLTGMSPADYICAYQAQKGIVSLRDADGETIANSEGLLKMEAVYSVPGLTDAQRKRLFQDFGVGKSVQGYNRAAVEEHLERMR